MPAATSRTRVPGPIPLAATSRGPSGSEPALDHGRVVAGRPHGAVARLERGVGRLDLRVDGHGREFTSRPCDGACDQAAAASSACRAGLSIASASRRAGARRRGRRAARGAARRAPRARAGRRGPRGARAGRRSRGRPARRRRWRRRRARRGSGRGSRRRDPRHRTARSAASRSAASARRRSPAASWTRPARARGDGLPAGVAEPAAEGEGVLEQRRGAVRLALAQPDLGAPAPPGQGWKAIQRCASTSASDSSSTAAASSRSSRSTSARPRRPSDQAARRWSPRPARERHRLRAGGRWPARSAPGPTAPCRGCRARPRAPRRRRRAARRAASQRPAPAPRAACTST